MAIKSRVQELVAAVKRTQRRKIKSRRRPKPSPPGRLLRNTSPLHTIYDPIYHDSHGG